MIKQTWGLEIPGFSNPTQKQKKYFAKLYPDTVAWHRMEQLEKDLEQTVKDLKKISGERTP